jgi:hypothetical protein
VPRRQLGHAADDQAAEATALVAGIHDCDQRRQRCRLAPGVEDPAYDAVDPVWKIFQAAVPAERDRLTTSDERVRLLVVEHELEIWELPAHAAPECVERRLAVVLELGPDVFDLAEPSNEVGTLRVRRHQHELNSRVGTEQELLYSRHWLATSS